MQAGTLQVPFLNEGPRCVDFNTIYSYSREEVKKEKI